MRVVFALSVLVCLPALLGAGGFAAPSKDTIEQSQRRARDKKSLAEKLVVVTEPFLGAPYAISPLGEGAGADVDADPRIRFDEFDCTTFVETALALALTDDLEHASKLLDTIRYTDGEPTFLKRRHFPVAEWMPQLAALGFLEDVTRTIGGDAVSVEHKLLNAQVWDQRKRPSHLELPDERIPDGDFVLDVWPLDDARAGQKKIPAGTLLNVVRVDFKSVPVRVSHQGIVIEKRGKLFLRHAADRMYHSVVDEPLDHFFHRMQQYKKWPVRGVNLARLREPTALGARVDATPAPVTPLVGTRHAMPD